MKKLILTLITILFVNLSFSQWTTKNYVDDFGEETENQYKAMITKGSFSNSATQKANLLCKFVEDLTKNNLLIYVFEYESTLANSIETTYELVRIKAPDGEIYDFKNVVFFKKGFLYFEGKNYEKLMEILEQKGDHILIFDRSGKYSQSSYKTKFTIK